MNYKNLRSTFFLYSKVTNTKTFREKYHYYSKCFKFMENEKYYTGGENNNLQNISAV